MNKILFEALYAASPIPSDNPISNTPDTVGKMRCLPCG
jgi:hypothetical protein